MAAKINHYLSSRSMRVSRDIQSGNRYVTLEEFENLESRIQEFEEKCMFDKKVEEERMLERFDVLNDRIMIVDSKDFRTNLRMNSFQKQVNSLHEVVKGIDMRCKKLDERFESVRPVTSIKVKQKVKLGKYDLVPLTVEQLNNMACNSTCVNFIGRLVLSAFPDRYFEDHGFADITNVQFIGLFQIIGRYFESAVLLSGKTLKLSLPCNRESKSEVATIMENEITLWKKENGCSSEVPVDGNTEQKVRSGYDRDVGIIQLSETELDELAYKADSVVFIGKVTIAAFPKNFLLKRENTPKSLSMRQLDAIYEMIKTRVCEVKRRGKPSMPLSKKVVFSVIFQRIRTFRVTHRHLIF